MKSSDFLLDCQADFRLHYRGAYVAAVRLETKTRRWGHTARAPRPQLRGPATWISGMGQGLDVDRHLPACLRTVRGAQADAPRLRPNGFAPHANEYFWLLGGLQGVPLGLPPRRATALLHCLIALVTATTSATAFLHDGVPARLHWELPAGDTRPVRRVQKLLRPSSVLRLGNGLSARSPCSSAPARQRQGWDGWQRRCLSSAGLCASTQRSASGVRCSVPPHWRCWRHRSG